jgi:beta-lysine 5,6-aminomutase beta subunit
MREDVDQTAVRPYADHLDDGLVQVTFSLPLPEGPAARRAALELAESMGLTRAEVVHSQRVVADCTYFVVYGRCAHTVDYSAIGGDDLAVEHMTEDEVEAYAAERIRRPIVVVGASTGTDTHSVGIDAMLNIKGFDGEHGLEAYRAFETYNLGSQVSNGALVAKAVEVGADAVLVSQTVTQQDLHVHNLTRLVELIEAEGLRRDLLLVCGGSRISDELAKELGFDAGFSKGTYPHHLASYLVRELAARMTPVPAA